MHIAKAAFPTVNLAPWMTIHTKAEVWILAGMETVADIGEELERRTWLDEQDKNGTFGSAMEKLGSSSGNLLDEAQVCLGIVAMRTNYAMRRRELP